MQWLPVCLFHLLLGLLRAPRSSCFLFLSHKGSEIAFQETFFFKMDEWDISAGVLLIHLPCKVWIIVPPLGDSTGFSLRSVLWLTGVNYITTSNQLLLYPSSDLPRAALRILSNMTFLFVSLSYTAECAIVTAFITFIPKFIESQFGIPASNASIYTGERSLFGYSSLELVFSLS